MAYDYTEYLNINTLEQDINNIINDALLNDLHIDINNYKELVNIKHSTFSYLLTTVRDKLFRPKDFYLSKHNNKGSYIDFNNAELLSYLANIFIKLSVRFNKSVGLYNFAEFIGCDFTLMLQWASDEGKELNGARYEVLRNLQESHKTRHISLLNDSVVGQIAVANNDVETGLKWAEKQQQQAAKQAVYFLPSERLDRLRLEEVKSDPNSGNV